MRPGGLRRLVRRLSFRPLGRLAYVLLVGVVLGFYVGSMWP